jgi:hypothetical protein
MLRRIAMGDYEFNPGILIGGAAAVISVFAALAALYLRAVKRARQRLDPAATPQERAVIPWLNPLVLPVLVILCLGIVADVWHAYEERRWPGPALWVALMSLPFWLKIRKKTKVAHTKE